MHSADERFKPIEPQCRGCGDPARFAISGGASGDNIVAWCARRNMPVNVGGQPFYARALFDAKTFEGLPALPIAGAEKCHRCGEMKKLERHHYAPRAQFGDGCDDWATGELCRACHEFWHERMGQPIGASRKRPIEREILRSISPIECFANKKDNNNGW